MFSNRTGWPLTPNRLITLFDKFKSEGTFVFDLTVSNPTRCGFVYPQEEILKALSLSENMGYAPQAFGSPKARKLVSQDYQKRNISLSEENIVLTSSSSESYSFLFRLLLNPDDHLLLPKPSYPLFEFLGNLNDAAMDFYSLCYQDQWSIDLLSIERAIGPKTKAIVLVHPNNPTGSYLQSEELAAINAFCGKHHLAIICDEVFLDYSLEESKSRCASLAANSKVLTFALGGLSKSLGLPQMKLSWIAVNGPEAQTQEALKRLEIIADTYLSVNTPSQNALGKWFSLKPAIQNSIKERLRENQKVFFDTFPESCSAIPLKVQGGWYGILRVSEEVCEEELAFALLAEAHVFVHPGYFFDFDQGHHLVISFLTEPKIFAQGLKSIYKYL
ncbi:MAG: pyridoxal phosphate-dependent aminotransferase [Candidatus Aceula meridiana]|nr:pyridoxal phosphate-dependent aminotransferase [Candidatus Aceula meridiana]